ncbi:hypothetical protein AAHA92_02954 [Salvia divinorum]|uniref:Uncharacterized protein n=1 Tax=Salvia divinorum TaxID=28513 RepID=A0ABD1II68_SALDI
MRYVNWVEVAPAPVIFPQKASNAPNLETIAEEGLEKMDAAGNKISHRPTGAEAPRRDTAGQQQQTRPTKGFQERK